METTEEELQEGEKVKWIMLEKQTTQGSLSSALPVSRAVGRTLQRAWAAASG
ncbi:hypothetical protein FACS189472_16160 [Alphaproteobacteria bacterium]|nr:hypothetical protein FACS189472_16160 [Alphaproteobacteria bacterium]